MNTKSLLNLNLINQNKTVIFFIMPSIHRVDIETLNLCFSLLNKYEQIYVLCSHFERSFYHLMINKSPSLVGFKTKIEIDIINPIKFAEIQTKEAIIISFRDNFTLPENNKKAILCTLKPESDILFNIEGKTPSALMMNYLKSLLLFMQVKEKQVLKDIEITPEQITKGSSIVNNLNDKEYYVIVLNNFISSMKISNFLRKHKLKKQLIIISHNKINVIDPKLFYFKEHTFLDFLAFQLQAVSIYGSSFEEYSKTCINLKIHLNLKPKFKDFKMILDEIT
ncbi:MAG: hypothetical protein FWG20_02930 [Candidatus Cloacimonetes bacterium]|nr:hypothetical protein [Candidatus Cloacimonadota bacterium]